jgi:hypothetical protein
MKEGKREKEANNFSYSHLLKFALRKRIITVQTYKNLVSQMLGLKIYQVNIPKGLNELLQLEAITYYYYKSNEDSLFNESVLKKENIGFVAQEVAKVFPEAIDTASNGYLGLNIHPILIAYLNTIKKNSRK